MTYKSPRWLISHLKWTWAARRASLSPSDFLTYVWHSATGARQTTSSSNFACCCSDRCIRVGTITVLRLHQSFLCWYHRKTKNKQTKQRLPESHSLRPLRNKKSRSRLTIRIASDQILNKYPRLFLYVCPHGHHWYCPYWGFIHNFFILFVISSQLSSSFSNIR